MSPGVFNRQEHLASAIVDELGILQIPSTRIENACSSGSSAIRQAILNIKSGNSKAVIVCGVEKMSESVDPLRDIIIAADRENEGSTGATFTSLYAMIARRYMHDFGVSIEDISK